MIQLFGILFLLKQCLFEIHLAPCITHNSALISPPCAALYGEALAALLVVQLTLSLHATSFILEGDSITVTLTLQYPKITQDWCIASIISHVHTIIPPTTSWPANHVNRNKTHHEDFVPNALVISAKINKLVLEHHSTWNSALVCSLEV
jgi:hypothetical protein